MTNEQVKVPAGQAAAGAGEAPPAIDIAALLADDAKADETIKVADLKPFLEQHTGQIVERVTTDLRARQESEARVRREADERNASAKTDRDYARSIEARLRSADEAERVQAQRDMDENRDRYRRGLALDWEAESQETRDRAIAEHINPLLAHIKADGKFQPVLDMLADPAKLADANGNWFLASLREAEAAGYSRGKNEAAEAAEQAGRIENGTKLPPALNGSGGGGGASKLTEGIQLGTPGSTRLLRQRLAAQQK